MGKPGRRGGKIMGNGVMSKLMSNESESPNNDPESNHLGTTEPDIVNVTDAEDPIENGEKKKQTPPIIQKKDVNLTKSVSDLAITLSPSDLVWIRCQGGYYWPGIYLDTLEEADGMGADKVAVQFCEKLMRCSFHPFSDIIPLNDKYEDQFSAIVQIHQKIKKNWKPDAKYGDSLKYFQQFREVETDERKNLVVKIVQEVQEQKKKKKLERKMSLANSEIKIIKDMTKEKVEIIPEPEKERHSKSYKLRPSVKKPEILESSNWNKTKNDNATTLTTEDYDSDSGEQNKLNGQIAQVNKKTGRPYDGEELEQFVKDYFQELDKNVKFDKLGKLLCNECLEEVESSDVLEFCHDAPYHKSCLTEIVSPVANVANEESSEEGKKKTKYKCQDCFSKVCFLCKSADPIDQPWDGIPITKEMDNVAKCSKCELHFHRKCLLGLSYGCQVQGTKGSITCPRHFCQTCFCESIYKKYRGTKLVPKQSNKCVKCLNSYHKCCVPAGSKMLQKDCIICPAHSAGEALEIIERRKHIGCIICFKKIKAADLFISCKRCPLYFHEACYGYTEEVKNSGISKDDFCQDYICEFCQTHPYPTFGQIVWFHQPGSSIWPAMIVYPQEIPLTIKDSVKEFCFTIKYLGPQPSYYNFVTPSATLPFSSKTLEWVEKVGLGSTNKRPYISAVEEATFLLRFFETYRDSIIPEGSATFKSMERNLIRVPENIVPKIAEHKEHYKTGQKCSCNKDYPKNPCTEESSCVNRLSYFECSDVVCNSGDKCQNRFTGKNKELESKLEVFLTPSKGYGVRAKRLIKADENIGEYIGEVITNREALNRISMRKIKTSYVLQLDNKCSIDAEFYGNTSRFINHSCQPNCIASIVANINGKKVALLRSLVDIEEGTELTFSYGKSVNFNCNCGAPKCVSKFKPSESWNIFCDICSDGGILLLCEFSECHKSYHLECLKYDQTPKGKWYCSNHPQMQQKQKRKSSLVPHTSNSKIFAASSILETKINNNLNISNNKEQDKLSTNENNSLVFVDNNVESTKARTSTRQRKDKKSPTKVTTTTPASVKSRSSFREKLPSTITEMLNDISDKEKGLTVTKEEATNSKNEKVGSHSKDKPVLIKTKSLRNSKESKSLSLGSSSINGNITDRGEVVYSTRKSKSISKKDSVNVNSIINEINLIHGIETSEILVEDEEAIPEANGIENSEDSQDEFEQSRQQTRSSTSGTNNKRKRESSTPTTQIQNRSKRIKTSLKFMENNSKTTPDIVIDLESAGRDVFERKSSVNKTPINLLIRNRRLRMNERRSAILTSSDDAQLETVTITDTATIPNPVLEELIENELD